MKKKIITLSISFLVLLVSAVAIVATVNEPFAKAISANFLKNSDNIMLAQTPPAAPPSAPPGVPGGGVPPTAPPSGSDPGIGATGGAPTFAFADPFVGNPSTYVPPPPPPGSAKDTRPYVPVVETPGSMNSAPNGGSSGGFYTPPSTPGGSTSNDNNIWGDFFFGSAIERNDSKDQTKVMLAKRFGWINDPKTGELIAVIENADKSHTVVSVGGYIDEWRISAIDRGTLTLVNSHTGERFNVYNNG